MPDYENETCIALVPKVVVPESPSQFRPIALCNFFYKIVSKVLVSKLKPVMQLIISKGKDLLWGKGIFKMIYILLRRLSII